MKDEMYTMSKQAYNYLLLQLEKKLKELMPEDEFDAFITENTRAAFKLEIEGMADGDFKDFVLEHFSEITK